MYHFFMALVDIGFYIVENWKNLTANALFTAIGIIFGKRIGSRIAVNQVMKILGLEKKSELEQKVDWLIELEKERGNIWTAPTSEKGKNDFHALLKSLRKTGLLVRFARSITRRQAIYQYQRRIHFMQKFKSRKFWMAVISALLVILNDGLDLGIDSETVLAFAGIVMSFIFGEAYVDSKKVGVNRDEPDYASADDTAA